MAGIVDKATLSYSQIPDSAKIAMLSEAISQLQSEMAVANSRIEEIDGDFPQQILMGGGDDSTATGEAFGFQIKATRKTETTFDVVVYPGSAQVMGGMEKVFPQLSVEMNDGDYIWLKYLLWDASMEPIQAWQDGIQHGAAPPFDEVAVPKSMVFVLGQVSGSYPDNVVQFRLGSFIAVATIALSPDGIDAV